MKVAVPMHLYSAIRNQWKKPSEINELQLDRLRKIVHYAYENVPYYHRTLEAGRIRPKDISAMDDIQKLPFMEKKDIIDNYPHSIISRRTDISKCWIRITSGTSGTKATIAYSKNDRNWYRIARRRIQSHQRGSCWHPVSGDLQFQ